MAKAKPTRKKSAKNGAKPKIGRPLAVIDEARVAELAYKGLSNNKIAALMGVEDSTLILRFKKLLEKKRAERTLHIRERQLQMLDGPIGPGSAGTMAVWLGKNELGQTDKAAIEHSGAQTININVIMGPPELPAKEPDDSEAR